MNRSKSFQRKKIVVAVLLGISSLSVNAQPQDEDAIEEVIVTGSYIRGSPLDAPSPVQIVDRNSIEARGPQLSGMSSKTLRLIRALLLTLAPGKPVKWRVQHRLI